MSARALDLQRAAARLIKARTPSARRFGEYLANAEIYTHAHRDMGPGFRLPDGRIITAQFSFRPSVLFGRAYLVGWIHEADAVTFAQAFPTTNALMSPVAVPWSSAPLPVILAPGHRRRSRSEAFLSILEHEIVHANQVILGLPVREYRAATAADLRDCFFTDVRNEFEAHLIECVRWPPHHLASGKATLSLAEWVLLRAYTPAIEKVLRAVVMRHVRSMILPGFLEAIPDQAVMPLRQIGCPPPLVAWFQARWWMDVAMAMRVLHSQGVDVGCAALGSVRTWLTSKADRFKPTAR